MNSIEKLTQEIRTKRSFLCVGLDPDFDRMPNDVLDGSDNPIWTFNKAIIDATADYCVAYKLNFAFYEAAGIAGLEAMRRTVEYIPDTHFKIADAKRGDIGNTARKYAYTIFERHNFDAVTLAPYMGQDAIMPFLEYEDKVAIVLALTSNESSLDFQFEKLANGRFLYEEVIVKSQEWANSDRMMFVVGATHPKQLRRLRERAPSRFFLVPGVGAQGGDLRRVYEFGANPDVGLIVNSSRGIIYAGDGPDFAAKSADVARDMHRQMKDLMG